MSLGPERVERLQTKLYEKAKREPAFRFYSLYDKACWAETLALAYQKAKANRGAPGVDGVTFAGNRSRGKTGKLSFRAAAYLPIFNRLVTRTSNLLLDFVEGA